MALFHALAVSSFFGFVLAGETGLTGFPANLYDPVCATACLRSFYELTLDCSSSGVTVGMVTFTTTTQCYANNTPYLTSVAWCAHTQCPSSTRASLLEYWWELQITGQQAAGVETVPAKWSYAEALAEVKAQPSTQLSSTDTELNTTSLVPLDEYQAQYNVLSDIQTEGTTENAYGLVILLVGFGLPILTVLQDLPFLPRLARLIRPYLMWPSTIGSYYIRPLPYSLGNAPNRGQAIYIIIFVILNIVLTAVNYQLHMPSAWYATTWDAIMSFVLSRTGNFAYIMMPLLFLFGGRNNILLWCTDWSHSTYLLLHRWIARVFTVQAILHSIVALVKYCETDMYSMAYYQPYWIWGIVATICAVILCFGSGIVIRQRHYETFLLVHIVLSALLVVSCWYHAYDLYGFLGGYCDWLFAVFAVWAFERLVRLLRVCINGVQRARFADIGDEVIRIDVPDIRWTHRSGCHAYLYFPTITPWRPWENHPFSAIPTAMLRQWSRPDSLADESGSDVEKTAQAKSHETTGDQVVSTSGLTFFVRRGSGFTKALRAHSQALTLVEGPYTTRSAWRVLSCDRLLLLGGGIGITALVPFIANHQNAKLFWSMKSNCRCLVDELSPVLARVDKEIRIASRFDLAAVVAAEVQEGWQKIGIVVSGPGSFCDDARVAVIEAAKLNKHITFELDVESYSW